MPPSLPQRCPACAGALELRPAAVPIWSCEQCHGTLLGLRRASLHARAEHALEIWNRSALAPASTTRRCPACAAPFRVWSHVLNGRPTELDACRSCQLLWFDAGELDELRIVVTPPVERDSEHSSAAAGVIPSILVEICMDWFAALFRS